MHGKIHILFANPPTSGGQVMAFKGISIRFIVVGMNCTVQTCMKMSGRLQRAVMLLKPISNINIQSFVLVLCKIPI